MFVNRLDRRIESTKTTIISNDTSFRALFRFETDLKVCVITGYHPVNGMSELQLRGVQQRAYCVGVNTMLVSRLHVIVG